MKHLVAFVLFFLAAPFPPLWRWYRDSAFTHWLQKRQ